MEEDFLYHIWKYKLFSKLNLFTVNGAPIFIVKAGLENKNSGPDFLNSQLKIDNQIWVGNVEMHLKSSDWYLHKHEEDVNYDAVILHVVWEHDAVIFRKNNTEIPTLELKNIVDKTILNNYKKLVLSKQKWIPCENQISKTETFLLNNWLERLYFERLEQKSILIKELLKESNFNFEAVLFQLLAKNFGLKVNGDAFLQLAKSIDFSIIRKVQFDKAQLSALLFGQAGFLEDENEDFYYQELKKEYQFLKHKYQLKSISKNMFQFFRMRPNNFPTIRIAQFVALYHNCQNLFSKLIVLKEKKEFYNLLSNEVDGFWKTHYTFETTSKKSAKKISKAFIDLLLINTIIPLKLIYLQNRGEAFEDDILQLIQQVNTEKNSIISNFSALKVKANNAMESQALIQLKNNYCTKKQCLQCAIGNRLLKES